MTSQDKPAQFYYSDCRVELNYDLENSNEINRLAASQDPDKPIYFHATAWDAVWKGGIQDAKPLCRNESDRTIYISGCVNAMIAPLIFGVLGG